ncbi:response regulator [Fervidibacter sacchari]|jgi:Response regulators consisting of a CheY-like receiver domain and a winged-helix DNA-binding domain|uniref:DNA-binding response OmpR family regulator n=1 Tax=Candidatus Fervidibacter sacchari TaxID=1448929 RepID=A0ABT2EI56_9BACT|nr:response regulator [Candidatus Fervidibacter sacchari]MCS3917627.1 DNA-binding response OmpR family regulator [Candidatus Fervidibacter sacchari]WKU15459.1 response regulator [Candidatus Fervidibacter sacchari]
MAKYILVVEDEDAVRSVIAEAMRLEGLEVREARNGEEAMSMFLADPPALVILDVLMPGMSGLEVCQSIRNLPEPLSKTPIIMLTAIDTRLGERLGKEAGADIYLTKPFSPRELRQKVRELLSRSEAEGR